MNRPIKPANLIITPVTSASVNMNLDEISTVLYILEGYLQGNDDTELCKEIDNLITKFEIASETIPFPNDD